MRPFFKMRRSTLIARMLPRKLRGRGQNARTTRG
jgi:hypothetical protein